jgi:hypothetical protein
VADIPMRASVAARQVRGGTCLLLLLVALCVPASAAPADRLLAQFRDPPNPARPRVWWHWMNGNITKDGIRRDLAWMKRIGIGGVDAIDASIDTPQVVDKRLIYMTPEWKSAFRYAARLADRNGLELAVDSSPGWSETGGPWVGPQAAMKKLVWSRTEIEGAFHDRLPQPPSVAGPFQTIARSGPSFYRDSLVVAYHMPVVETHPRAVDSNGGAITVGRLDDGDLADGALLKPPSPGDEVWARLDYGVPVTVQGVTLALSTNDGLGFVARIEASADGASWRGVADVPPAAQVRRFALLQQTIAFAPVTARYLRLVVRPAPAIPNSLRIVEHAAGSVEAIAAPPPPESARFYRLYELAFHAAATVNEFEKKAGFAIGRDNYAIAGQTPITPGSAVKRQDVIDLTSRMQPDGSLDWEAPPGRWMVLRLGWSLTGAQNHPATPEATGLEVDKLNRAHVRDYLERYLGTYRDAAGADLFGRKGLTALMVDSTEVGAQNWTETMLADFRRLRGYDPLPWLPALTGQVVETPEQSDRFLWDFRRTIAQLLAENHYGEIARIARKRGLTHYGEALEDHRPTFGDDMEMRHFADIPMGAMWSYGTRPQPLPTYVADLQGAASVAHLYGRGLVAAESLTSAGQPWAYGPRALKPVVDMEFALGVNRVVIHTSVHQPVEKAPGLSLGGYGQFFTRLESWAEQAKGWISYIARCSHLLQQGQVVADAAYFYGEEAPITGQFGDAPVSDVPRGHGFDFINAEALLHLLSVDHGDLVTQSGMRYRLLYLGGSSRFMTLPVLRRLRELVLAGATVVGRRPESSPSLADDDAQFTALAGKLFGHDGAVQKLGQGRVFASGALADAFAALSLPPDFVYGSKAPDTEVLAIHRHLPDREIYFLTNRRDRAVEIDAAFRVKGLKAELWDAVTGKVSGAAVREEGGVSRVSLSLPSYGSVFVVFGRTAAAPQPALRVTRQEITGSWNVTFQPGRGAPEQPVTLSPGSWSGNADAGIRYFSGTATYKKHFDLPQNHVGRRLILDLGEVREAAEVWLNGKKLGSAWTPPFRLDATEAVRPGRNSLTIKVANLWVNRLIGDAQPDARRKYGFTAIRTYRADAPLRASGLLGPVFIESRDPR